LLESPPLLHFNGVPGLQHHAVWLPFRPFLAAPLYPCRSRQLVLNSWEWFLGIPPTAHNGSSYFWKPPTHRELPSLRVFHSWFRLIHDNCVRLGGPPPVFLLVAQPSSRPQFFCITLVFCTLSPASPKPQSVTRLLVPPPDFAPSLIPEGYASFFYFSGPIRTSFLILCVISLFPPVSCTAFPLLINFFLMWSCMHPAAFPFWFLRRTP